MTAILSHPSQTSETHYKLTTNWSNFWSW